ncbi:MAG TPA: M20/M25/M40 family metallo-hydrolase [Chloroflexota bacterium]|nr:M20/M25/M40 family metallo-hydrolase [Chloroflexota bacterium]
MAIASLSAERTTLQPVFDYIDQNVDEFVERLRRLCRQPSVSAQNLGLLETAEMVEQLCHAVGARTERIRLDGGPPIIYGVVDGKTSRRLQLYDHYDVQPPEPLGLWHHEPFAAEIADGRIWARGVSDNKGNLVARLCAIEAYQQTLGQLPLTVTLVFEGEEEVGSPHLRQFTDGPRGRELLSADACIWEAGYKDPAGRPTIALGCKGILYVELRVRSAAKDLHSSWGAAVPNAAWRLTWALSTLKDPKSERVLIPGFYDAVKPPPERMLALADREPFDVPEYRQLFGIDDFLGDWDGQQARRHYLFDPTCTICGLSSGYQGPGGKTVLPAEAFAKIDFRLVPDQDPDEILSLLRKHLDTQGFRDVDVEEVEGEGERAARSDPDAPIAAAVVDTAREVYGLEPLVLPNMAGTGPQYLLCAQFGVPAIGMGVGNADSNNHAPNENILVSDYVEGIKHAAWVFLRFAAAS